MAGLIALIFSIVLGALAQLSMKAGLQEMSTLRPDPLLVVGAGCYAIAMISWIVALKRYDLTFAYPLLSLGYLIVYLGAALWPELNEELTWNKTLGLLLVALGVTLSAHKSNYDRRIANERQRPS